MAEGYTDWTRAYRYPLGLWFLITVVASPANVTTGTTDYLLASTIAGLVGIPIGMMGAAIRTLTYKRPSLFGLPWEIKPRWIGAVSTVAFILAVLSKAATGPLITLALAALPLYVIFWRRKGRFR